MTIPDKSHPNEIKPPQASQKQLDLYSSLAKDLDAIMTQTTKEVCADNCYMGKGTNPRCCNNNFYECNVSSEEFLRRQAKEAIANGWQDWSFYGCKYLISNKGCAIKEYKPPVCIGTLCMHIVSHLIKNYESTTDFIRTMSKLTHTGEITTNESIEATLSTMQEAVTYGKEMLKSPINIL